MSYPQLKLENQLCFRLYSASRLITQAYYPLLSEIGLTYPQYLVMMVLWECDRQPVNLIAERLLLETNTVTPLLKRMEAAGWLLRQKNPSGDGRQVIVSLTEKGKALEERAARVPFKMAPIVACDSLTEETAPQLFRTLDDLCNKLVSERP